MDVLEAADEQRDWLALPTGVTQHIFCLGSTWQTPGPCLASLVCRTWRSAAGGCRGIRLLFHAGHYAADQGFRAWLARNGRVLRAFTLSSSSSLSSVELVLEALADADAAAKAAGQPLPLHTLRVLQSRIKPQTAGRWLAALPNLCCLQLGMIVDPFHASAEEERDQLVGDLTPLQHATQLQELYLKGLDVSQDVAQLLPLSLRRLSLEPNGWSASLTHLTQLTFLHLSGDPFRLQSSQLPAGLRQLHLIQGGVALEVLESQRQVLTGWWMIGLGSSGAKRELLGRLPNLRAATVSAAQFCTVESQAAFKQLKLSALTLFFSESRGYRGVQEALAAAASISSLRRLHIRHYGMPELTGVAALTQLTQLRAPMVGLQGSGEQQRAWGELLGLLCGLQWLSVPGVLVTAGHAWLGGLQQLRVLVLRCRRENVEHLSNMSWAEVLPPQVQWLGVSGVTAEQAATLQLRRRLQQALSSRGCQVVVGVDLDEAADPTQQLAGVPEALQQALA